MYIANWKNLIFTFHTKIYFFVVCAKHAFTIHPISNDPHIFAHKMTLSQIAISNEAEAKNLFFSFPIPKVDARKHLTRCRIIALKIKGFTLKTHYENHNWNFHRVHWPFHSEAVEAKALISFFLLSMTPTESKFTTSDPPFGYPYISVERIWIFLQLTKRF